MNILVQILLKVLLPAFMGIRLLWKRRDVPVASAEWATVDGQITGARIDDNDTGSVTQYCPVLEVRYVVDGRAWQGIVAAPRHISPDRAGVQALLRGVYAPGRTIALTYSTQDPGRVMVA